MTVTRESLHFLLIYKLTNLTTMVKVYFETPNTAELVAIFDNEETYEFFFSALERLANESGMFITESIEDETRLKELVK